MNRDRIIVDVPDDPELACFEHDPNQLPHHVESQPAPERSKHSDPPYAVIFDPNDKYPVHPDARGPLGLAYGPEPPQTGPSTEKPRDHTKRWKIAVGITGGLAICAVIGGAVGGVYGTRHAEDMHHSGGLAQTTTTGSPYSPTLSLTLSATLTDTSTIASPSSTISSAPAATSTGSASASSDVTAVDMFTEDACSAANDVFKLQPGTSGCQVVPSTKRSILVRTNNGCNVTTWSSDTCNGLNFKVNDSECHSVLYAAISYSCP